MKPLSTRLSKIYLTGFLLNMILLACSTDEMVSSPIPQIDPTGPIDSVNNDVDHTTDDIFGDIRSINSMEYVAEMGVGWNMGNSFDVRSANKTEWGNPLPTKENIVAVRNFGFTTLRIPVTWNYNMQAKPPYIVDPNYLNSVQEIVEFGLRQDMHVIINTHHDDWIEPSYAEAEEVSARLSSLWTQIANHFADYGDKLIFEVMNEPRLIDSPQEWSGGTAEGRDVVNQFIKVSLDAIGHSVTRPARPGCARYGKRAGRLSGCRVCANRKHLRPV